MNEYSIVKRNKLVGKLMEKLVQVRYPRNRLTNFTCSLSYGDPDVNSLEWCLTWRSVQTGKQGVDFFLRKYNSSIDQKKLKKDNAVGGKGQVVREGRERLWR